MCSAPVCVKQEAAEIVLDLPGLGRGDSFRAGANARKQSSEPSSPSLSPLLTPKAGTSEAIHQELDDDLLLSLRVLFDGVKLDDFDDDSDTESEDAPPSPAAKGYDPGFMLPPEKRTYFYAMGRLYFYDEERNVYLDNSPNEITLVHMGKPFMLDNEMFNPDFFIDGIPYYFDCISGALLYQDQGTIQNVCTWTSNSQTSTLNATFSPNFTPRTTSGGVFQSNSGFAPITFEFQQYSPEQASTPGMFCKAKREAETPNSNSLGNSFHGTMPWSPGSSMLSPIVSAGSRASSSEPLEPLIKDDYAVTAGIQVWQHEVKQIQEARAPSNKMDRRRCPQCNKLFRRPSSLEDHLNVHSGNKPHVCPYKDCKTGFATKSNMKRHFLTHRLGSLEDYHSGLKVEKSNSRTTTYNSKAFHTQRFRLTAS